jgi:hypothetical protein
VQEIEKIALGADDTTLNFEFVSEERYTARVINPRALQSTSDGYKSPEPRYKETTVKS